MKEYVIARNDELANGERKIVTIGSAQIGLFRIDDNFYALPNVCTHQFGPLCRGSLGPAIFADASTGWKPEYRLEGQVISCPWHNLEFHVPTGQCLAYPQVHLRKYLVKVEGDEVKIVL
jgi:nitrite reductase (NADH) small subunit